MNNQSECKLHGVIPAIVTPMNEDGSVNYGLLEKQADYLMNAGVNGLFVCGGTGEGAYLTTEEKRQIYKTIRATVGKRLFLCLAAINSNTPATVREMAALADCDADFWVSTTPFYHGANQDDILEHYRQVAAQANAPIIVYNIPSATHNNIELETVLTLSQLDNVAGTKDSSGNFIAFSKGLFGPRKKGFAWIQGEDYLCAPALLCGGDGMVSGLSNARVEPYVAMYRAHLAGDIQAVKHCQSRINDMYRIIHSCGNGNAAIKAVTELSGRGTRWMRQHSFSLSDEQVERIHLIMEQYEANA